MNELLDVRSNVKIMYPSKRRHEDPDNDPHEGEKRQRVTDLPGFRQGRSIRTMSLSNRPEGSQRGGGYRRSLGEEDCSIFLASGEESVNKRCSR